MPKNENELWPWVGADDESASDVSPPDHDAEVRGDPTIAKCADCGFVLSAMVSTCPQCGKDSKVQEDPFRDQGEGDDPETEPHIAEAQYRFTPIVQVPT